MDLVGQSIGNFVVRKKIGGGGMGTVYLCEHPLLGRKAALKVLHPELAADKEIVDRFFHEAKAATDIGNEHIVDIFDFGRVGDVVYILMELLDGESLGARQRTAPLPPMEALGVIGQCCVALQASHEKGIVHRDLKPENIFLCQRGTNHNFVKLVDFGIAKLMTGEGAGRTRTGMLLGTPQYMSPEQCEGRGKVDHRADIYSLGVVMYELFAKRPPFNDEAVGDVLIAHMTRLPSPPSSLNPDVPPCIEAIILHALEKDPARRFQSMNEMLQALGDPDTHLEAYQRARGAAHSGETLLVNEAPSVTAVPDAPTMHTPVPQLTPIPSGQIATPVVTSSPHHASKLTAAFGVVASAAVVVAVVLGIALLRRPTVVREVRVPAPAPAAPAPPVVVEKVTVTIVSEPPGATVSRPDRGNEVLGSAPVVLTLRKGEPPFVVNVKRDGYRAATRAVEANESKEVVVLLAPEEPPAKAKPKVNKPTGERLLLEPKF